MKQHHKLLISQALIHLIGIVGIFLYFDAKFLWLTVAGVFLFAHLGIGIYCHRYLAHHSFETSSFVGKILNFLSIMCLQGPPMVWAANHVTHHKNADQDGDPHPASSWFRTWFWIGTDKNSVICQKTIKRLSKDKIHKNTNKHYYKIYWSIIIISSFFDFKATLYLFVLPVIYAFHMSSFTNVILHKFGYRNFETNDKSMNLPIPILLDSAYHNNHHAMPKSYNMAVKWHEFDMLGHVIDLIRK
jgi:stearoyl-CoA desaturase (delta-9 desaturase)